MFTKDNAKALGQMGGKASKKGDFLTQRIIAELQTVDAAGVSKGHRLVIALIDKAMGGDVAAIKQVLIGWKARSLSRSAETRKTLCHLFLVVWEPALTPSSIGSLRHGDPARRRWRIEKQAAPSGIFGPIRARARARVMGCCMTDPTPPKHARALECQRLRRKGKHRLDYYADPEALRTIDSLRKPQSGHDASSILNRIVREWAKARTAAT